MKVFVWVNNSNTKVYKASSFAQRRVIYEAIAKVVNGWESIELDALLGSEVPDNKLIAHINTLLEEIRGLSDDFRDGTGFVTTQELGEQDDQ